MADKTKGFGMTSKDEGVYIPPEKRMQTRPEYLKMSKADVLKDMAERAEKDKKVQAYAATLDRKAVPEPEAQEEESAVKKAAKKKKA